jgi:hypothetical protein
MTPAERKRWQRSRDHAIATEQEPAEWPERVCLLVLQSSQYDDAIRRAAWKQLGRLKGWIG